MGKMKPKRELQASGQYVKNPNFGKSDEIQEDEEPKLNKKPEPPKPFRPYAPANELPDKSQFNKRKAPGKIENQNKKAKLLKDLHRPLTVDEINELKETEDLYHSNLFRMQIDELLKEVTVPESELVSSWVSKFKLELNKLPKVNLDSLLKDDKYPLSFQPEKKFQVHYEPPENVSVYGSHSFSTDIAPNVVVDVFINIPSEVLKKDDYLNHTYFHKRALYLFYISKKLLGKKYLCEKLSIVKLKNNILKPVLEIVFEKTTFLVHAIPSEEFFKLNRFIPRTNNIKLDASAANDGTPYYNSELLYDILIEKNEAFVQKMLGDHENVKNAIKLLKVWLKQRQFESGYSGFGGYLVTMYVVHLLQINKVYPTMSCYQIVRLFWNHFGNSNFNSKGITLCKVKDQPNQPCIEEFQEHFPLVFLDSTGFCNLLYNFSPDFYLRVRDECLAAIKYLNNGSINSFQFLFMTKVPTILQYDQFLCIKHDSNLYQQITDISEKKIDYLNNLYPQVRDVLLGVLRRGLGQRVKSLVPLNSGKSLDLVVGIILDPEYAFEIVDKGPQANDVNAAEYRKFWGVKSEIRRFKDGSITESVLWSSVTAPLAEKRMICKKIILFLLKEHFNLDGKRVAYVADQFESSIRNIFNEDLETNEEKSLKCIQAFDQISKELRGLNDLPLEIYTVLGVDPVFRYCDPSPPIANASTFESNKSGISGKFRSQKVLSGIIQLAPSGKWPEDLEAMKRIKAAFYLEIAQKLNSSANETHVEAYPDCIEVLKSKFLFRLKIMHPKEVALVKLEISATNNLTKFYKNNEKSLQLEFEGLLLPKLTSALHGLHHQHASFGATVSIAKRWLNAQMIDSALWPEECTELLIADMFVKENPMIAASQPQTGFFRFLQFLAAADFNTEMVILNFNDELSQKTIEDLEVYFSKKRQDFPALCIVTSCDYQKYSIWTAKAPSVHMIQRVQCLAQCSLDLLKDNFYQLNLNSVKALFTPSLEGYDVLIHLNDDFVKKADILLHNFSKFKPIKYVEKLAPPADINFVQCYLKELRAAYDDFAVFFIDPIGGSKIAVLWKPTEPKEFTTSHVNGYCLRDGKLQVDHEVLLKDFETLGEGLVTSIELLY